MQFFDFFEQLGFSKNESLIFLTLYKLGSQPASIVSKYLHMERTTVYKILLRLVELDLVSVTEKRGSKYFFIQNPDVIQKYIKNEIGKHEKLNKKFDIIASELRDINKNKGSSFPKISLFDGIEGIKNIYNDIYENIIKNAYFSIKLFASNVFDDKVLGNIIIKNYSADFFEKLKKRNISVEAYLGNGVTIMENIVKVSGFDIQLFENLPAGNSVVNIFIAGKIIYIIIFKEIPFGIKIDSEDLSGAMHFIFDNLKPIN